MIDGMGKLRARLLNWGYWLAHDADIGPKPSRCISLESRYIAEAGDVWDDADEPPTPTPNVSDAEAMEAHIRQLEWLQRYVLAVTYGGMPAVFKFRRIGDHVLAQQLDIAEALLYEMLKKRA